MQHTGLWKTKAIKCLPTHGILATENIRDISDVSK